MRFVILEDNHDRQDAMRACLAKRLHQSRIEFHEAAGLFIESLAKSMADVTLIGLDHDLEMRVDVNGQLVDPGTGMDAVEWLCRQPVRVPCGVHTTNYRAGAQMTDELMLAG